MAADWIWVAVEVAMAAHAEQLAEHGGGEGVRDPALLESAMARAQNLAAYGEPDAADLAAAYAFGIARNHPDKRFRAGTNAPATRKSRCKECGSEFAPAQTAFVDGNKRTAAVISETFLMLNGHRLDCSDAELAVAFLALAAGELTEEEMADWFRAHLGAA